MGELIRGYHINGGSVSKIRSFCNIDIYQADGDIDECVTIYFCSGSKVVQKLQVTADCGQNVGYIDDLVFTPE